MNKKNALQLYGKLRRSKKSFFLTRILELGFEFSIEFLVEKISLDLLAKSCNCQVYIGYSIRKPRLR